MTDKELEASRKRALDVNKARVLFHDGYVAAFDDQQVAYSYFLNLPRDKRAAFRGIGDYRVVEDHDYVRG